MIDDPLGFWHAEFEPRLARVVVEELVYPPSGSSRSTCDSLDIGRPPFLNGGLHNTTTLRVFNCRNWAKCRRRETRQKNNPDATSTVDSYKSTQETTASKNERRS